MSAPAARELGGDGRPRVLRVGPDEGRVGVVLISEVFGIDDTTRDYAAKLVGEGFGVAMPDLWWRRPRPSMDTPEEVSAAAASVVDSEAMVDVAAAFRALSGFTHRFALGFCLGGLYARMAGSAVPGLAGAVEFYGRIVYPVITPAKAVQPLDLLFGLGCPLQCHFGAEDPVAPPEHVDELERRLAARGKPWQVFRYPGCGHAFMNPRRPRWRPDEAATAWARALTFIRHVAAERDAPAG